MDAQMGAQPQERMSQQMHDCIQDCTRCHTVCLESVVYCLNKGGKHAQPDHIRLLLDCAEICQTSANFMLRMSPQHGLTCGACAEICDRCADSCNSFMDDLQMQACAQVCRKCAASCREMASMAH